MSNLVWQDWVAISGLVVGLIGLFITTITWKNTRNIAKQVSAVKIKEVYPKEHPKFVKAFSSAQISLSEGERKYYIISDLLKTCRRIQKYYDNWDNQYKKEIDKFTDELDEIPTDGDIDETTRIQLQKKLFELEPMLERIGDLNGIR